MTALTDQDPRHHKKLRMMSLSTSLPEPFSSRTGLVLLDHFLWTAEMDKFLIHSHQTITNCFTTPDWDLIAGRMSEQFEQVFTNIMCYKRFHSLPDLSTALKTSSTDESTAQETINDNETMINSNKRDHESIDTTTNNQENTQKSSKANTKWSLDRVTALLDIYESYRNNSSAAIPWEDISIMLSHRFNEIIPITSCHNKFYDLKKDFRAYKLVLKCEKNEATAHERLKLSKMLKTYPTLRRFMDGHRFEHYEQMLRFHRGGMLKLGIQKLKMNHWMESRI